MEGCVTTLYYNILYIFLVHIEAKPEAVLDKLKSTYNQAKHHNKAQVSNFLSLTEVAILDFKKTRLVFHIVLTVKMCEMFPVKRKPGINLDTVFFVRQPANVMYVTGQRAMSLLHEWGRRGHLGEKRAVLTPRTVGRLVVISWPSCVCV